MALLFTVDPQALEAMQQIQRGETILCKAAFTMISLPRHGATATHRAKCHSQPVRRPYPLVVKGR